MNDGTWDSIAYHLARAVDLRAAISFLVESFPGDARAAALLVLNGAAEAHGRLAEELRLKAEFAAWKLAREPAA